MIKTPRPFRSIKLLLVTMVAISLAGCLSISDPKSEFSILSIAAGNNQSIPLNATTTQPLIVATLDQSSYAVQGVMVTWAITAGSGTLSTTTSTSDANGAARVTYTPGTSTGAVSITATAKALTVTFTATVVPAT